MDEAPSSGTRRGGLRGLRGLRVLHGLHGLRSALTPVLLANHYPPLHGLRVLAVVLVVQLHVTGLLHGLGIVPFTTGTLWFGMDLFFFLSGFLIGSMLLADSASGRRPRMLRFYLRRSLRIVPPYLVVLSLLCLAFPLTPLQQFNLWKEYLYLTNYVPPLPGVVVMPWAWSLALEEHFYLLVPLLVILLRALPSVRAQLVALSLLWSSALALRCLTVLTDGPWEVGRALAVLYVQTHLRYDILVAGIFTACLQRYQPEQLARQLARPVTRYALGALSGAAFAVLLLTERLQAESVLFNVLCWGTLTSIAYMPLVLLVLNHRGALASALSHRAFIHVATLGYGIYLLHIPVIHLLAIPAALALRGWHELPWPVLWPLTVGATLALSGACAYVLHILVEKPALVLRDRLEGAGS